MGFLNPLYNAVAWLLVHIHTGLAHVVGNSAAWSLSIVVLTVSMRLVLFPVFVKQIRSQRAMQAVQPKMKELQAKYKNDKEKLNQEMMALWKDAGVNPLSGCLPLFLQIPIFISLFHTLKDIKPKTPTCNSHLVSCYTGKNGFSQVDVFHAAHAKLFGIVPISASFKTSSAILHALGGSVGSTRALCLILTIIMGATTFITQKQLMARNGPAADSQQAQTQKIMLYVFPVFFLAYGFFFPVGVLLYWLTTNVWSMVQQYVVIHRMDAPATTVTVAPAGPRPGAKPNQLPRGTTTTSGSAAPAPATGPAPGAKPNRSTGDVVLPPGGAIAGALPGSMGAAPPAGTQKPPSRPPANRSNKRKRRGRR
jgi:YidC/Oxa1 family membrane protein insertase